MTLWLHIFNVRHYGCTVRNISHYSFMFRNVRHFVCMFFSLILIFPTPSSITLYVWTGVVGYGYTISSKLIPSMVPIFVFSYSILFLLRHLRMWYFSLWMKMIRNIHWLVCCNLLCPLQIPYWTSLCLSLW